MTFRLPRSLWNTYRQPPQFRFGTVTSVSPGICTVMVAGGEIPVLYFKGAAPNVGDFVSVQRQSVVSYLMTAPSGVQGFYYCLAGTSFLSSIPLDPCFAWLNNGVFTLAYPEPSASGAPNTLGDYIWVEATGAEVLQLAQPHSTNLLQPTLRIWDATTLALKSARVVSNWPTATLGTLQYQVTYAPASGVLYVNWAAAGAIVNGYATVSAQWLAVDVSTATVTATSPVLTQLDPFAQGMGAFSASDGVLYTYDLPSGGTYPPNCVALDASTLAVVARTPLSGLPTYDLPIAPATVDGSGQLWWQGNGTTLVRQPSPSTSGQVDSYLLDSGNDGVAALVIDSARQRAYAFGTADDLGPLYIFDSLSGALISTYHFYDDPAILASGAVYTGVNPSQVFAASLDPGTGYLAVNYYSTTASGGAIAILDPASATVVGAYPIPSSIGYDTALSDNQTFGPWQNT